MQTENTFTSWLRSLLRPRPDVSYIALPRGLTPESNYVSASHGFLLSRACLAQSPLISYNRFTVANDWGGCLVALHRLPPKHCPA